MPILFLQQNKQNTPIIGRRLFECHAHLQAAAKLWSASVKRCSASEFMR